MSTPTTALLDAVTELHAVAARTAYPLAAPGAGRAEADRRGLAGQLEDYLLPRLRRLDAPLLAVVGGSTGAGKSTLVNSLVGAQVSAPGVLRPTTRGPVLLCHPDEAHWFADHRILPGLPRSTGSPTGDAGSLRVVPHAGVPTGLALLDAPDVDSVVTANRELAGVLLAAADLWIFVTTAARYADAVPWDLLRTARDRGTAIAVILDRCPPAAMNEVGGHLNAMLTSRGLGGAPLFVVPEVPLTDGRLGEPAIAPIRTWLTGLASDAEARAAVVRHTLDGALASLGPRAEALATAAEEQAAVRAQLEACVNGAYDEAMARVDTGVREGALLRGEVLARWQDVVGTGELLRRLESRIGRLRDRVTAAVTGRAGPVAELEVALESGVATVVRAAAEDAAEASYRCWREHPAGPPLLGSGGELSRPGAGLDARIETMVRDWQGFVLELVRREGASKRTSARAASYGVNGAGLLVMLAVFSQTAGLTGAEVAVAGGTSVAGQKVIEAMFGDTAVRQMAKAAQAELLVRVRELLSVDALRFAAPLGADTPDPGALRAAAAAVRAALDDRR